MLSFIAVASDDRADQRRDQQHVRGVEIAARQLLVRDSERYVVEARAAEARLDHRCEHAQLAELA